MEIKVDTKHDSHEDIRKVIKMLQHIIGEEQAPKTNNNLISNVAQTQISSLFEQSSTIALAAESVVENSKDSPSQEPIGIKQNSETEDLFAELFSDDEIKKMEPESSNESDEDEHKQKSPYRIEIY